MADSLAEPNAVSSDAHEHELEGTPPGVVDLAPTWAEIPWRDEPPSGDIETLDDHELEALEDSTPGDALSGAQTLRVARPSMTGRMSPPKLPDGARRVTGALPPPMPAAATGTHAAIEDTDDPFGRLPAGDGFQTGPSLPASTQRMRPRDMMITDQYDLGSPATTRTAPPERRPAARVSGHENAMPMTSGAVPVVPAAQPSPEPTTQPTDATTAATTAEPEDDVGAFMAEIMASDDAQQAAEPGIRRTSAEWFAEVFDETWFKLLPDRLWPRTAREVQFVQESLGFAPGAELLDLGCGYGRHTLELAERGYRMSGVDLSRPLLERGAGEARRRNLDVAFMHGDMRELAFDAAFDGILCMQTTFGYFDDHTNFAVLQGMARALRPGGRLLIEVMNRDYIANHVPRRIWWDTDEVLLMEEVYFDWDVSRLRVHRTIVDEGRDPWEQTMTTRMYSAHELTGLLQMCGLNVLELSGEFAHRGTFLGPTNRHLILLAERPR